MVGPGWHIAAALSFLLVWKGFSQSPVESAELLPIQADGVKDSVRHHVDSLVDDAHHRVISLRQQYDSVQAAVSVDIHSIERRIDSLSKKQISTDRYTARLDSIRNRTTGHLDSLTRQIENIQAELTAKLSEMNLPPEVMSGVTSRVAAFTSIDTPEFLSGLSRVSEIPGGQTLLAGTKIPTADISIPPLDNPLPTDLVVPDVLNLPAGEDIGGLADPLAPDLTGPVPMLSGELPATAKELSALSEGVPLEQVTDVLPASVDNIASDVQGRAEGLAGTSGVTEQLTLAGQSMPVLPEAGDEDAAKEELKSQARQVAVNHFAGKEEQLQQAMDKLSALKRKYGSIQSLADLPKKVPNPMSSKTFVERLVPGLLFQVGRTDHWLLDINLYLGYRFNERMTAGAGWNQRVAYDGEANGFATQPAIYGPRLFGAYDIGKGFSGRLEAECMNTYVPPQFASRPDSPAGREWVVGVLAGMKKTYTITRRLKGTVAVLYNLYDPYHRSPYKSRLNGRFGVEWVIE